MQQRSGSTLTSEHLYERALAIVDEDGLEALTMRRLAADVGVQAPSLYNHVASKEDLLDGALALMRSEVQAPVPLPEDWKDLMEALLTEYRRVLTAHPNMMPLAARRLRGDEESGLNYLADQGFSTDEAVELWQSLVALVVGFSMFSSGYARTDSTGLRDEFEDRATEWREATCTRALRTIMDGYQAELDGRQNSGTGS